MAHPRDLIGVVLLAGATILASAATPSVVFATGGCKASFVVLGQVTPPGATITDWFNVFGEHFDPSVTATITFSVPVIPWSLDQPSTVQPAVTSFTMPDTSMFSGFKWTFRAQNKNVQEIHVRISGNACTATTVVDFSPPDTSIEQTVPTGRAQPPVVLLALLVAAGAGAFAIRWRLRLATR